MTKLEQIEKSVAELSEEELKAFAKWFDELRLLWDRQTSGWAGRLDKLIAKAKADLAGRTRPLSDCYAAPEFWEACENLLRGAPQTGRS